MLIEQSSCWPADKRPLRAAPRRAAAAAAAAGGGAGGGGGELSWCPEGRTVPCGDATKPDADTAT